MPSFAKCAPHAWQQAGLDCPYGTEYYGVTFQSAAKLKDMREQHPNATNIIWADNDFRQDDLMGWICAMYGFVPYAVFFVAFLEFLYRRGTRELNFILCTTTIIVLNEGVIKPIVSQPRPEHSCVTSCGMPSGHSAMAVGSFVMCCLDVLFRMKHGESFVSHREGTRAGICSKMLCDYMQGRKLRNMFSLSPLAYADYLKYDEAIASLAWWAFWLVPVPISRIVVQDHTPEQVMIGSLLGGATACAWTFLSRRLQRKFLARGQNCCCHLIKHNYSLPRFMIKDFHKKPCTAENTKPGDRVVCTSQLLAEGWSEPLDQENIAVVVSLGKDSDFKLQVKNSRTGAMETSKHFLPFKHFNHENKDAAEAMEWIKKEFEDRNLSQCCLRKCCGRTWNTDVEAAELRERLG